MDLKKENGYFWPNLPMNYGRYEKNLAFIDLILPFCNHKKNAIQAGGHCGLWPKKLSKHFENVYTFEPCQHNFRALMANVTEKNIFAARGVLGAFPHFVGLHVNEKNTGGHWVEGSGNIPVYTIDGLFLKDVSLIALDVEGSELFALQGAIRTIDECSPVIVFEDNGNSSFKGGYEPIEIYDLLLGLGYNEIFSTETDRIWVKK